MENMTEIEPNIYVNIKFHLEVSNTEGGVWRSVESDLSIDTVREMKEVWEKRNPQLIYRIVKKSKTLEILS